MIGWEKEETADKVRERKSRKSGQQLMQREKIETAEKRMEKENNELKGRILSQRINQTGTRFGRNYKRK